MKPRYTNRLRKKSHLRGKGRWAFIGTGILVAFLIASDTDGDMRDAGKLTKEFMELEGVGHMYVMDLPKLPASEQELAYQWVNGLPVVVINEGGEQHAFPGVPELKK